MHILMKWGTAFTAAAVLSGCAVLTAFGLGKPDAAPAAPKNAKISLVAAGGDSLRYRLAWGPARGATGYEVVVRPVAHTTAGWSGLPANQLVTTTDLIFTAINTTYDSVRFRAVVWSRRGTERSRDSSYVEWSVRRALGAPGPITVDSSMVITGMILAPQGTPTLELAQGDTQLFCALLRFGDGAVAWRATSAPEAQCETFARQLGGIPTTLQQSTADAQCITFRTEVLSGTINPVVNQQLCSGEARIVVN